MESFPQGKVTRLGIDILQEGAEPLITYTSPDKDFAFYLHGGLAPHPGVTEGVVLADGPEGLHPDFKHLDHKGARQRGVSWAGTVYDPAEINFDVVCTGRTPEGLRNVVRKWFASWDPEKRGTLSWVTPDGGEWWCKPRLFRPPQDKKKRGRDLDQDFKWSIRNDDAFWCSHDSVSTFGIAYRDAVDTFARDDAGTLGPNWKQTYTGPGGGVCETQNDGIIEPGRATWTANDPQTFFTGTRRVVIGPYVGFNTSTDEQDISLTIDNTPEFASGSGAANYIWGRMGRDGSNNWNGYGIRAAIGFGWIAISVYVNFVKTDLNSMLTLFPPLSGQTFTLKCLAGQRKFELWADSLKLMDASDDASISAMGSSYRGVGFGLQGGGAILTQATPAAVRIFNCAGLSDTFGTTTTSGLGANWPLLYGGSSNGYVRALNGNATWVDTAEGRKVVNRWLGANSVQKVSVFGDPTSWALNFNGAPTISIAHPATPAQVQTALVGLPSIGTGDVVVTGDVGGPYNIEFQGIFTGMEVDQLTGSIVSGGTEPYVTVATTTVGANRITAGDNQVVSLRVGTPFQALFGDNAFIDIWARMNTNDIAPTGIRLRISRWFAKLSRFNAGVETVMENMLLLLPTLWNQEWKITCGTAKDPRRFIVQRDGAIMIDHRESGTNSAIGADYRGAGFGLESGSGTFSQQIPPSVLEWRMGDNSTITQSGHLTLTNFGDQVEYPDLVVYGPGTFTFGDGADAEPTVTFGPISDGQRALIRTHPGARGVYDLPPATVGSDALKAFKESLTVSDMYKNLKGRFSKGIPPKPVGGLPAESKLAVTITDGNASSQVIAAITPRRRWPE